MSLINLIHVALLSVFGVVLFFPTYSNATTGSSSTGNNKINISDLKPSSTITNVSDTWDVQCGGGKLCDSDNPVCCSTGQPSSFCVSGGSTCCSNRFYQGGCGPGTTCCPTSMGSNICCSSGTTCDVNNGLCTADSCSALNEKSCKKSSSCGWCCDTQRCMDVSTGYCPSKVRTSGESCPDPCSSYSTCNSCASSLGLCGWCCETQSCMSSGASNYGRCSYYSWIAPRKTDQCEACAPGGEGLYHVKVVNYTALFFTIIVPIVCGCFCFSLCMQKWMQRRQRQALDNIAAMHDDDDGHTTATTTTTADGARHDPPSLRKYGFDDNDTARSGSGLAGPATDSNDATTTSLLRATAQQSSSGRSSPNPYAHPVAPCSICMERASEIVFLPCYHAYCCAACSTRLERTHRRRTPVTCPFCRAPVETMVNLRRVFYPNEDGAAAPTPGEISSTTSASVTPHNVAAAVSGDDAEVMAATASSASATPVGEPSPIGASPQAQAHTNTNSPPAEVAAENRVGVIDNATDEPHQE
eukprot:PhM_4_TR8131/c0_g1_i1/m.69711